MEDAVEMCQRSDFEKKTNLLRVYGINIPGMFRCCWQQTQLRVKPPTSREADDSLRCSFCVGILGYIFYVPVLQACYNITFWIELERFTDNTELGLLVKRFNLVDQRR